MTASNDKPLRVLCITRAYGEHAGGMERLSFELISALKKQIHTEVTVLAHTTSTKLPLFWIRLQSVLFTIFVIPTALRQARSADVIHLGDPVLSLIGWLIQRLWKKPIAVSVHGLDVSYEHILYTWYVRSFFRFFDLYIPISTYARTALDRCSVKGQITVIQPGFRDQWYAPEISRHQLAALLGQNIEGKKVLLTSGRLVKRKGHAWFIASILPLLDEDILYIIAGDGPEREAITNIVRKKGLENKVVQLGRVDSSVLKVLYNTVDAFIQPNISVPGDAEGFGIVLLEAASCNRPVFAAELEGIPQAVHQGKNGILLPSGDPQAWTAALQEFMRNPYVPPQARDYTLQYFSWDTIATQYREALARSVRS